MSGVKKGEKQGTLISLILVSILIVVPMNGLAITPNDQYWDFQWNLPIINADSAWDIDDNQEFTNIGTNSIILAYIGSGFTWDPSEPSVGHPDILSDIIWKNPDEQPGDANGDGAPGRYYVDDDGDTYIDEDRNNELPENWEWGYEASAIIDDDENGYYDDIYGFNFLTYRGDVEDLQDNGWWYGGDEEHKESWDSHGIELLGLISAVINNEEYIAGIAPRIKVMILKIADYNWQNHDENLPNYYHLEDKMNAALQYAISNGADVVFTPETFPYTSYSESLLNTLWEKNIPLVVGVGDEGDKYNEFGDLLHNNIDYPANYKKAISVGALDSNNKRASYSQYVQGVSPSGYYKQSNGPDIVVPSGDLGSYNLIVCNDQDYLLWPGEEECNGAGTHYTSSIVAATVCLMLSSKPTLTAAEVKRYLDISADDVTYSQYGDSNEYIGWDPFTGYGRLNIQKLLQYTIDIKPDFQTPQFDLPPNLFSAYITDIPIRGNEPAMTVDTNGYMHTIFLTEMNGIREIKYSQKDPNMKTVPIGAQMVDMISIEQNSICQLTQSSDPSVCINHDNNLKTDILNIIWIETETPNQYSMWFARLDTKGNFIQTPMKLDFLPDLFFDCSILSSKKTQNIFYIVYSLLYDGNPYKIYVDKMNKQGIKQGNSAILSVFQTFFLHPSAHVVIDESGLEYISVLCDGREFDVYNPYNPTTTQLCLWVVANNPQWPTTITTKIYHPRDNLGGITHTFQFIDPSIDVEPNSNNICGVFREIPNPITTYNDGDFVPSMPYTAKLKYCAWDLNGNIKTYTHEFIDISIGTNHYYFNPKISINRYGEIRCVFEEENYLRYFTLRENGLAYQYDKEVFNFCSNKINQQLFNPPVGNYFNYQQVASIDLAYPGQTRNLPNKNDGAFYLIFIEGSFSPAPNQLFFSTTNTIVTNTKLIRDASAHWGICYEPGIAIDDYGNRHIVWQEWTSSETTEIYYNLWPAGSQNPLTPLLLSLDPLDTIIAIPQITVTCQMKDLSPGVNYQEFKEYKYWGDNIFVHIIWVQDNELWWTEIVYSDVNDLESSCSLTTMKVSGLSSYSGYFSDICIESYTNYMNLPLFDPIKYQELIYILWNSNHDLFIMALDWDNTVFQSPTFVATHANDPDIDIDSNGNIYVVYEDIIEETINAVKIFLEDDELAICPIIDILGDIQAIEKPKCSNPQIVVDRDYTRNCIYRMFYPRYIPINNNYFHNYENNKIKNIHIIFNGDTNNVQGYQGGNILLYRKLDTNGMIISKLKIIMPANIDYWYYSNSVIDAKIAINNDNEVGIIFSSIVKTNNIVWGYNWPSLNDYKMYFISITNNGEIKTTPLYFEAFGAWYAIDCSSPTSNFEVISVDDLGSAWVLNWYLLSHQRFRLEED